MKKSDRKIKRLQLNRETVTQLSGEALTKVQGANGGECTGCDSGCGIIDYQYFG